MSRLPSGWWAMTTIRWNLPPVGLHSPSPGGKAQAEWDSRSFSSQSHSGPSRFPVSRPSAAAVSKAMKWRGGSPGAAGARSKE